MDRRTSLVVDRLEEPLFFLQSSKSDDQSIDLPGRSADKSYIYRNEYGRRAGYGEQLAPQTSQSRKTTPRSGSPSRLPEMCPLRPKRLLPANPFRKRRVEWHLG